MQFWVGKFTSTLIFQAIMAFKNLDDVNIVDCHVSMIIRQYMMM